MYAVHVLTVSEIHISYNLDINVISPTSNEFLELQKLKRVL